MKRHDRKIPPYEGLVMLRAHIDQIRHGAQATVTACDKMSALIDQLTRQGMFDDPRLNHILHEEELTDDRHN